jgi:hypothetical protein
LVALIDICRGGVKESGDAPGISGRDSLLRVYEGEDQRRISLNSARVRLIAWLANVAHAF